MTPLFAVLAALGGAAALGIAAVSEHRGTKRVEHRNALSLRLLLDLARQPLWLTGLGTNLAGFGLQVVALRFGPLALVQPVLVADLVFAALISAFLSRRWDPAVIAGVVACAAGVAGFVAAARPSGGRPDIGLATALPLLAVFVAVLAGCLALARLNRRARPIALALACGIDFGVSVFLVKLVTAEFSGGLAQVLGHWAIYALVVTGPAGFLLNQNAFQQGKLLAPVLAVITVCDPIVSIGIAHVVLSEKLGSGPLRLAGWVTSLVVMAVASIALARHGPHAARQLGEPV